jgi:hypothetical protein
VPYRLRSGWLKAIRQIIPPPAVEFFGYQHGQDSLDSKKFQLAHHLPFWLLAVYFVSFILERVSFGDWDGAEDVLIWEGYEKWDSEIYPAPT